MHCFAKLRLVVLSGLILNHHRMGCIIQTSSRVAIQRLALHCCILDSSVSAIQGSLRVSKLVMSADEYGRKRPRYDDVRRDKNEQTRMARFLSDAIDTDVLSDVTVLGNTLDPPNVLLKGLGRLIFIYDNF